MKTISTTDARKKLATLLNLVKETGEVVAIGRHNKPEVIMLKFPQAYDADFNEITNTNATSTSFDFLADEPDVYTVADLKKRYV